MAHRNDAVLLRHVVSFSEELLRAAGTSLNTEFVQPLCLLGDSHCTGQNMQHNHASYITSA